MISIRCTAESAACDSHVPTWRRQTVSNGDGGPDGVLRTVVPPSYFRCPCIAATLYRGRRSSADRPNVRVRVGFTHWGTRCSGGNCRRSTGVGQRQ